jgi:hypothetical protein
VTRTASCSCGGLRVVCEGEPKKVSLCHCLACQKRKGSPYGIGAFFGNHDVILHGRSKLYTRQSDSGFSVIFHFCPDCGSTVFWKPERLPDLTAIAVGAFADPTFQKPTNAVYVESRHSWVGDL